MAQNGIAHGNIEDSERTFVEIYTIQELVDSPITDWSTLGQIMVVMANA